MVPYNNVQRKIYVDGIEMKNAGLEQVELLLLSKVE
jgi:hypothetical protein